MRISIVLSLGALLGLTGLAAAQGTVSAAQPSTAKCICVLLAEAGSVGAALRDVRGRVLLAGDIGYAPVQTDIDLSAGDRVIVLADGQALLVAGETCRVALAARSMTSLVRTDTGLCVAQSLAEPVQAQLDGMGSPVPPAAGGLLPSGDLLQAGGLFVTGGLIAGAGAAAVSAAVEADDPVSP